MPLTTPKYLLRLSTLLLLLLAGLPLVYGQLIPLEVRDNQAISLHGHLYLWQDSTAKATINEVITYQKNNQFKATQTEEFNSNYTESLHWACFGIKATSQTSLLLEIQNPAINYVEVFEQKNGQVRSLGKTGDLLPYSQRPQANINFIYPITLASGESATYFLVADKRHQVLFSGIKLWKPADFMAYDGNNKLFWGLFMGVIFFMTFVNLFLYFAEKDPIHIWFVVLLVCTFLYPTSEAGLAFSLFWPNFPWINQLDPVFLFSWASQGLQVHFMQLFIGQTEVNSRLYRYANFLKYSILVNIVFVVLVHLAVYPSKPTWAFMYEYYLNLVFMLVYVMVTIFSVRERLKQKDTNARYFFNALIILCIGIFCMFFWESIYAQFGKQLFIETYVLGIMTIVGYFMALSIALTYRYNLFKKQNEQLQLELFKAQEKTSKKIIEALEVERNRIAEDLYDDVGAILSTAIGYLSSVLRRAENKEKFPILGEARKLLDRAIENLRTVSHNLMPKNFAQLGLSKSLTESINKVSQTSSIRFEYLLVGKEQQLEASVEVQIFRIAAELINDVVKNSDATQATMQLIYGEENLTLLIEHDGTIAPVYNNLTSKVDFINGKLEIDTTPSGVTAVVEIPYQYNLVS